MSPVGREGDHKCGNKNRNNGNKMHKILLTIAPTTVFYIKKLVINEQEGKYQRGTVCFIYEDYINQC